MILVRGLQGVKDSRRPPWTEPRNRQFTPYCSFKCWRGGGLVFAVDGSKYAC